MTAGTVPDPAFSTTNNLLVIAPPGCGKTELLARRASHLIERLDPHQQILALTFSNRAKKNLSERLHTILGTQRLRHYVRVTNFHGLAADVIRAHGQTIGLEPDSPMPRRSTLEKIVDSYTEGLNFQKAKELKSAITTALAEAKRGPFNDEQVRQALERSGNISAQEIEAQRREEGVLHYDDLLRHAQRLLEKNAVSRLYQLHYGAVLVDEFQDLSPQQLEIALAASTANRTFVGDPLQGIYSWAGARPKEVEEKLRNLCGEPQRLTVSYRSSPAVLNVVNRIGAKLDGEPLQEARPQDWPRGGTALAKTFDTAEEEANWIVAESEKILASTPEATIGVLARERWRRKETDAAFAAAPHLPHQRWDFAIQNSDIALRIISVVSRLPREASMNEIRSLLLTEIDPGDVETLELATEGLDDFENFVARTASPRTAVNSIRVVDNDDAIEPGVHLLNAHTGKGQQFDWVFIPGLEEFHIPSGQARSENEDEELRILHVMVSRAQYGIVATRARSRITNKGKSSSPKPSRWWTDISDACAYDQPGASAHARL